MHQISDQTKKWVEDQLEGKIKSVKLMPGGTSSQMSLLQIKTNQDTLEEVVLREYTDTDWLKMEPTIAFQEAENLKQAEKVAIPTPKCLSVDGDATQTTWPSLLMSKVEGKIELKPKKFKNWFDQLAKALTAVHEINTPSMMHEYFRYFDSNHPVKAEWSAVPNKWRAAFELLNQQDQPDFIPSFIHRDYHPTNVLFKNGKVSGIVDWPNACLGPKEIDIGHCRWNLAMLFGQQAAEAFLEAYHRHNPSFSYDAYWDLEALGNVFTEERPEIYAGWETFGITNLTEEKLIRRLDEFLLNTLERM